MNFQTNGFLVAAISAVVLTSIGSVSSAQSYCPSYGNSSYYVPSSSCQTYSHYSYQPQYFPQSYSYGYGARSGIQTGVVQTGRIVSPANSVAPVSQPANRVLARKPATTVPNQPASSRSFYPNSAPIYQPSSFPSYSSQSSSWCYGGS